MVLDAHTQVYDDVCRKESTNYPNGSSRINTGESRTLFSWNQLLLGSNMLLATSFILLFVDISTGQYIPTLYHPLLYPGLKFQSPSSILQPYHQKAPTPYISLGIELERSIIFIFCLSFIINIKFKSHQFLKSPESKNQMEISLNLHCFLTFPLHMPGTLENVTMIWRFSSTRRGRSMDCPVLVAVAWWGMWPTSMSSTRSTTTSRRVDSATCTVGLETSSAAILETMSACGQNQM